MAVVYRAGVDSSCEHTHALEVESSDAAAAFQEREHWGNEDQPVICFLVEPHLAAYAGAPPKSKGQHCM